MSVSLSSLHPTWPAALPMLPRWGIFTINDRLQTFVQVDRRFSRNELWARLKLRHDAVVRANMRQDGKWCEWQKR